MTVPVSTIDISRPPDEVFTYVTDPSRFAEWQQGVVSGYMADNQSPGPGATCVTVRRMGLVERAVTAEVTHVDPPRTWGIRGIDGPIRATVTVTVDPSDGGRRSRVSIGINFTGHGIGKFLVPFVVRPQARREMPANLQRLKGRLELSASAEWPDFVAVWTRHHGPGLSRDLMLADECGGEPDWCRDR